MTLFPCRNLLFVALLLATQSVAPRASLNNNDPAPPTAAAFSHAFLYTDNKECLKQRECNYRNPLFNLKISPFSQHATKGTDTNGHYAQLGDIGGRLNLLAVLPQGGLRGRHDPSATSDLLFTSLADVPGRDLPAGLITIRDDLIMCINDAVTFNRTPSSSLTNQSGSLTTLTDTRFNLTGPLTAAVVIPDINGIQHCFGPGYLTNQAVINSQSVQENDVTYTFPENSPLTTIEGLIKLQQRLNASSPDLPINATTGGSGGGSCVSLQCNPDFPFNELFGYFSIPQEYSKRGMRLEIEGKFCENIGFRLTGGIARITNLVKVDDQTISTQCPTACDGSSATGNQNQLRVINHLEQLPSVKKQTIQTNKVVQTETIVGSGPVAVGQPCGSYVTQGPTTNVIILPDIPQGNPVATFANEPLVGPDPIGNAAGGPFARWQAILQCIHNKLMNRFTDVARAVGVSTCNFNETSLEDLVAEVFWRRAFVVNENSIRSGQPPCLFIPFVTVSGSLGIAKQKDHNFLFSLPFGNNGHNTAAASTGFSFDFYDTIEVGFDAGLTHFFSKRFCNYRVPTNPYQNVLYPYATDVEVCPGKTWFMGAFMYGHNLIEQLSLFARYQFAAHERDHITVLNKEGRRIPARLSNGTLIPISNPQETVVPSPFMPEVLECRTPWSAHILDFGGSYAISPHFSAGLLVQVPLTQKNAYQSTTFMATFEINY